MSGHPETPLRQAMETPLFAWGTLVASQLIVCSIVFAEFLLGQKYFAYLDIGSDTWSYFLPSAMHLADYVRSDGWPGWSFAIGLGAAMFPAWDPFVWPYLVVGSENVLAARIWVFVFKLLLAGWAFFALLRRLQVSPRAAAVVALAYTFCGYALVNAQWDPFAAELALYPLLLLAVVDRLQGGPSWRIALVVAAAVAANVFVVSIGIFLLWAFAGAAILSGGPKGWPGVARVWLRRVVPPLFAGLLLAAPVLLPLSFLLLDSPRVAGAQALFSEQLAKAFVPADGERWLSLIAGFFHKDLLHIGNAHQGWSNYLETPVFYVGIPALLLLPHLWRGGPEARRAFLFGAGFILLYCALPAIAHMAFAFAVPYYRTSNLWIGILMLLMAARALDCVLNDGLDRRLMLIGGAVLLAVLLALWAAAGERVWTTHLVRMVALILAALALLGVAAWRDWRGEHAFPLVLGLVVLVAIEAALVGRGSFQHDRYAATPQGASYADWSMRAVEIVRRNDPAFYRIEKRIPDLFLNDALAQRYYGISSYHAYNGSSSVRLHVALGLLPERSPTVNYTNWLPAPGTRFPLYSLFGVHYLLAVEDAVPWPGLVELGRVGPLKIFHNEAALPLGVVYHRQIAFADFVAASTVQRDFAMFQAVVADAPLSNLPTLMMASLGQPSPDRLGELYFAPVAALQRNAMAIESFSQNRVAGQVSLSENGVLVLSIPYAKGWHARVNGHEAELFRANLGMSALALPAGMHKVELHYRVPGLLAGAAMAALGAVLLVMAMLRRNRRRRCANACL